MNNVLN